jgi:hypothetical protein
VRRGQLEEADLGARSDGLLCRTQRAADVVTVGRKGSWSKISILVRLRHDREEARRNYGYPEER